MTSILIVVFTVSVGTGADITSFDKQLKYIRLIVESYMAGRQRKHSILYPVGVSKTGLMRSMLSGQAN